jgi:hypothetical protein
VDRTFDWPARDGCDGAGAFFLVASELSVVYADTSVHVFDKGRRQRELVIGCEGVFYRVFQSRIKSLNEGGVVPRNFARKVAEGGGVFRA